MLCLTGRENTTADLARRLERGFELAPGCLQEVRLDALETPDADLFDLVTRWGRRLVVCCRSPRQGGFRQLPEEERVRLLFQAAEAGAGVLDADFPGDLEFFRTVRPGEECRLMASVHDFNGVPANLETTLARIREFEPDLVKVAVTVEDAADLLRLRLLAEHAGLPGVWVGMGYAGLLSRVRYTHFHSEWTYVCADEGGSTAPGQLTLGEATEMGLPDGSRAPFLALVGGPSVRFSPGPRAYNRLFRALGAPYAYVPVLTDKAAETFALLQDLGAVGASVTMPHKQEALECARPDELALRVGAANTVRFSPEGMSCTNTDLEGILLPLRYSLAATPGTPPTALVLGAGGAARAAGAVCEDLGWDVVFAARDLGKAARKLGPRTRCVPWGERAEVEAAVLINATPSSGPDSPWPDNTPLRKRVVFDLALGPEPCRLLRQAWTEGAVAIPAVEMWLHQGAAQVRWLTGLDLDAETLREYLP
ncbi:MAG: type I 3-dehydroquinate dehydratase [Acidobacteria bacterium]|nr:type I 3-dehydroquinate dehydratase [Acidobacteriota bacterium]